MPEAQLVPTDLRQGVRRLEVIDVGDHRVVRVGGHDIACYLRDDQGTERVIMTQLAETLELPAGDVAGAFGVHWTTLSRYRSTARSGGGAALIPRKPGPRRPTKVTAALATKVEKLRGEGKSLRVIANELSRPDRKISYGTVKLVLARRAAEGKPQSLPLESAAAMDAPAPIEQTLEPTSEESVTMSPQQREARSSGYAGALLLLAGLARLDVWGALRSVGAAVGPWRQWGWAETVATVVLAFALRFRSVEDSKNALREDFGVLLGQPRSPGLVTLRQKIAALAESLDPLHLSRELFKRYLALEPVWEGLYYVDGHFCPYYGQHPTPKGWDAKRRIAIEGHTDTFVHDARGRALFFLSQPLNDSLARAIPALVTEIRGVHGHGDFTLVFDRGGFSAAAFRLLNEQGIGFITYLKGRKARRRHPTKLFRRGWFEFEQTRHSYQLFEKRTRVTGAGALRTILFLGDDGQQIPVLTNLDAASRAAKVVHCLRLRWRQENSFKYLTEHYGIEQLIQYGADPEQDGRLVPNPRRRTLKERIHEVGSQIEALEAQLGRALDSNQEESRPTVRGLKIAHGKLRQRLAHQRQLLGRLENRLRHTPAQMPAEKVGRKRSLLREDRRLVVNALKVAAYNAERLLALRFNQHFQRSKDCFSTFRSLLHLPGVVRHTPDTIEIQLARPDSHRVTAALEVLLQEINTEQPRFLADGPRMVFALAGARPS